MAGGVGPGLTRATPPPAACNPSFRTPHALIAHPAELLALMEAAGFEARVALRRKADEEVLSILHFKRRRPGDPPATAPVSAGGPAAASAAGAGCQAAP